MQALRIRIRQRPDDDRVDDAEDGRDASYAEREGQHDGGGEARRSAQSAPTDAEVADQVRRQAATALVARLFLQRLDVADPQCREPPCVRLRRARGPLAFHFALEVVEKLGVQLALHLRKAQPHAEAMTDGVDQGHGRPR